MEFLLMAALKGIILTLARLIFVIVALFMIFAILLQEGKGGGLAALGGTQAEGVVGATNPVRRFTVILAVVFFLLAGFITYSQKKATADGLGVDGKPNTEKKDGEKKDGATDTKTAPKAPAPKTPDAKTDAGKTDAGKTDAGKTDAGKTDAGKTDAKPVGEKTEDKAAEEKTPAAATTEDKPAAPVPAQPEKP
jgi:protein translocase SecG subunit